MHFIFEAIIIGFYTLCLYLIFSPFIKNFYILLLVVGFLKFFLAGIFGVHTWFCNNGYACLKVRKTNEKYVSSTKNLFLYSIIDAIAVLILGTILSNVLSKGYLFFVIGMNLHLLSELFLIHKMFCLHNCYKE